MHGYIILIRFEGRKGSDFAPKLHFRANNFKSIFGSGSVVPLTK